jgi:putative phage-type endonuclease
MIKQLSNEWFEQRKMRITGSNVGAILGVDPFRKPADVMRAMVRAANGAESEFTGNVATEWGTFQEQNAKAELEMYHDLEVEETGFHVHPEHDWLGASPDGFAHDRKAVVEIKCPYYIRNDKEPVFKTVEEQPHYYAQMQIEMYCTDTELCWFYQWTPYGGCLEPVVFDPRWMDENFEKLSDFLFDFLEALRDPEKYLEDKVKVIDESEIAEQYKREADNLKNQSALVDQLKKQLIEIAGGKKSKIGGLNVYQVSKAGSVSYAKVVKEHCKGIDLTPYTGKPSSYWVVK